MAACTALFPLPAQLALKASLLLLSAIIPTLSLLAPSMLGPLVLLAFRAVAKLPVVFAVIAVPSPLLVIVNASLLLETLLSQGRVKLQSAMISPHL